MSAPPRGLFDILAPRRPETGPLRGLLAGDVSPATTGPVPAPASDRARVRFAGIEKALAAQKGLSATPFGLRTLRPLLEHGAPPYSEAAYAAGKALFDLGNQAPPSHSSNVEIDGRPEGWRCTAKDGMVSCSVPGFGSFPSFPRPDGWPDYISSESPDAHFYDEKVATPSTAGLMQSIIANPTPGTSQDATPQGSYNDATPILVSGDNPSAAFSPVDSHVLPMPGTGRTVVMNVTRNGHALWPGVVFRVIEPTGEGGGIVHNIGIGAGALQKPDTYSAGLIRSVWAPQTNDLIEQLFGRSTR